MSILDFTIWLQATTFFTALRLSETVYPTVLSLHLVGMGLFGGMILLTDLRILNVILRRYPVGDVAQQLRGLKHAGLLLVATCGILMLGSKAEEYYYNAFFRAKLFGFLLVTIHALVFRSSVYAKLPQIKLGDPIPARAKLAASLSLVLWLGILIMGRGIGYIQPPLTIHANGESDKVVPPHFVPLLIKAVEPSRALAGTAQPHYIAPTN